MTRPMNWLPDDVTEDMIDPDEPKRVGECCECGCDIYQGDEAYEFDCELYCEDCVWKHRVRTEDMDETS